MKTNYLIDDKAYSVVAINGFQRRNVTREDAFKIARKMIEQMRVAGWRGKVDIYYRDGSLVESTKVGRS